MIKILQLTICLCLCALLSSGCSFRDSRSEDIPKQKTAHKKLSLKTKKRPAKTTTVSIEGLGKTVPRSSIEMNWEIPDQPVDSYQIRYGFSENQLDSEITLKVSELETFEDPVHGPAYRYYLHEIDPEQTLYLTISAFHADEKSEESKVYKVSPE